ncbi:MAG: NAD(P)H-hydrate dehydratase [Desulfobacterales bacterium]|jgi:NAD(P)H-hydrate epimerase
MYLVTASEMRAMDGLTIDSFGIPGRVLMENAGRGATQFLLEWFAGSMQTSVGVIAGKGNNGGDGFVIARYLAQKGVDVSVYLLAKSKSVKGDAAANLELLAPLEIPVVEIPDADAFSKHQSDMRLHGLWVDAILGTGLESDVKGYFREVINFLNGLNKPIFAVDVPSGLNSDTGQLCGACIHAQATATFGFAKTGLMIHPGADHVGKLKIVDIGIPNYIIQKIEPRQFLITARQVYNYFQPRSADTHKGRTGHLLVVAGSTGKTGAAAMTAMSAMRAGAGLVTLALAISLNQMVESQVLEAMTEPLPEIARGVLGESAFDDVMKLMAGKKCLAIGPGLGQAEETKKLVCHIIKESPIPVVVDADGINNLVGQTEILPQLKVPIILTPHPGEMARLLGTTVASVQQDRITTSREFAVNFNVHVILKGARTVIAHPDGNIYINSTGNSGMASGGMGDVLTGVIAGLVVQGFSPDSAARAGVYLHGAAADTLAQSIGPIGFLAGEVMNAIPGEIRKCIDAKP